MQVSGLVAGVFGPRSGRERHRRRTFTAGSGRRRPWRATPRERRWGQGGVCPQEWRDVATADARSHDLAPS